MKLAMRRYLLLPAATCMLVGAFLLGRAQATVPVSGKTLIYRGTVERTDGTPVPEADARPVTVGLWSSEFGGSAAACSVTTPGKVTAAFELDLEPCRAVIQTSAQLWIEIDYGPNALGARTQLGVVPYALQAQEAAQALNARGDFEVPGNLRVTGSSTLGVQVFQASSDPGLCVANTCSCPAGTMAIAGGARALATDFVRAIHPVKGNPRQYRITCARGDASETGCDDAWITCARVN